MRPVSGYDLSADSFLENHERNIKRTIFLLKRYLADPADECIHDLRTSVRRLGASHAALPGSLRSEAKTKTFVEAYKKFFRVSSRVRDLDVMMGRLARFGQYPEVASLLVEMRAERSARLADGERMAAVLERIPEPFIPPESVPQAKLRRRFRKMIDPLLDDIRRLLPVAIADPGRVEELHRLRIRCKRLRYLLEIVDDDTPGDLKRDLQRMQRLLGTVHDCDVMISFLGGLDRGGGIHNVIAAERQRRQRAYRKFVQFATGPRGGGPADAAPALAGDPARGA